MNSAASSSQLSSSHLCPRLGQSGTSWACPLCGGDASCAVVAANGAPVTDCWCFHVDIPQALLERIPPEQRGKSCLCFACLARFHAALERERALE